MKRFSLVIFSVMVLALGGCTSVPIHYHTLLPPMGHEPAASRGTRFVIDVLPVDLPAQLDQSQLLVRQGRSGMAVLDGERWASPFGDEVRNGLSAHLVSLLGTQDVDGLPAGSNMPVVRVKVRVRRLDAWPNQQVQLVADWDSAVDTGARHLCVTGSGRFDEVFHGGYAEMTSADQQAITALADRISKDVQALARNVQRPSGEQNVSRAER